MNTSPINRRPATFAAATTLGLVGALMATTFTSAQAKPAPDYPPAVPARTAEVDDQAERQVDGQVIERGCFITPPSWNEGLEGPMPRCYTYLP